MGDSQQFYNIFYHHVENQIANFINTDNNVRNIISLQDQKKHILNNLFLPNININNHNNYINMMNNNLTLYLQIIEFVRDRESPYMPGLIDFTKINYVVTRFLYHYAKLCMNNECPFSNNIHVRVLNIMHL